MTELVKRATLDALRAQIAAGYESHGTLHRLLAEWKRVDDLGIPGAGRLYQSAPIALGPFDDALLRSVIHLDQIGLAFAHEEATSARALIRRSSPSYWGTPGPAPPTPISATKAACPSGTTWPRLTPISQA